MRDASKLTDRHRARLCVIYIRQSSYAQVERNRESTARQYDLAGRAAELGGPAEAVLVIDEDLGLSGSGSAQRAGFGRLAAEVGLGHVGMILSLEVSRLARSNPDWYRLLDLCALTATLIADVDGIYDPADYTDRLSLGLKGTIAEAELHVLRERLHGGIRNKAARGELRVALPVGLDSSIKSAAARNCFALAKRPARTWGLHGLSDIRPLRPGSAAMTAARRRSSPPLALR